MKKKTNRKGESESTKRCVGRRTERNRKERERERESLGDGKSLVSFPRARFTWFTRKRRRGTILPAVDPRSGEPLQKNDALPPLDTLFFPFQCLELILAPFHLNDVPRMSRRFWFIDTGECRFLCSLFSSIDDRV